MATPEMRMLYAQAAQARHEAMRDSLPNVPAVVVEQRTTRDIRGDRFSRRAGILAASAATGAAAALALNYARPGLYGNWYDAAAAGAAHAGEAAQGRAVYLGGLAGRAAGAGAARLAAFRAPVDPRGEIMPGVYGTYL